ncbi:MAG: methyl-accepting chemotaxis protein [Pseudomonadota bacterium]
MFKNLRIRTGLMLVLGIFSLALWSAVYVVWTNARLSAQAMEDVVGLSNREIQPLQDTERYLTSALSNMDNAYIKLVAEDQVGANDYTRKASFALAQAKKLFANYRKAPRLDPGRSDRANRVLGAYDAYAKVLEKREEALYEVSLETYAGASKAAEQADNAFAAILREVIRDAEQVREELRSASQRRFSIAVWLAAGMFVFSLALVAAYWMLFERVLLEPLRSAGEHFDRIAKGDLTAGIEAEWRNEVGVLLVALRRMQQGLVQTVGTIRSATDDVNESAQEIAHGNQELSSRTEQQAEALENAASTLEQLSAAVRQNAGNTHQTNLLASTAAEHAVRGGTLMAGIVETMDKLATSSTKIADIVSVIDGIAFQTNILALNAAVEAARAGTQGKGFAVVAAEVRSLALRSADAAKEVKGLIETSSANVRMGTSQVNEAGEAMEQIVSSVQTVMSTMREIATATSEQAIGIEQVSSSVMQMDRSTQDNRVLVEQTSSSADGLREHADQLVESVSVFRIARAETAAAPLRLARR